MSSEKLSVEIQALVSNAMSRYDDALICDSLRYFIAFAGDIPAYAWGKMDWSARWATDWRSATTGRFTEAQTARDVQCDTGTKLYKVAANYTHAEIASTLDVQHAVSSENSFLLPWLQKAAPRQKVAAHPGGSTSEPEYFKGPFGLPALRNSNPGDSNDPATRVLYASHDHSFEQGWFGKRGANSAATQALAALSQTNARGRDALDGFLQDNSDHMNRAEAIVRQLGLATGRLPMDFIKEAITAMPGVIINRAELFNCLSKEWAERRADMSAQTKSLEDQWFSPGAATAYFDHANRCIKYYDTLQEQAAWLGSEGKKAGNAIDSLQLAYAQAARQQIGNLIVKLKAYLDAANSFTGSVSTPAKALAGVVNGMASSMLASWQENNSNADAILQVNKAAQQGAPDLGDAMHRAQPFPHEAGTPSWDDSRDWHARAGGPPAVTS